MTCAIFLTVYSSSAATTTNSNITHLTTNNSIQKSTYSANAASVIKVSATNSVAEDGNNSTSDLSINYKTSNQQPNYLKKIYLTVTVTNNGPDSANDVSVLYKLNNQLTWLSDDSEYTYDKSSGLWSVGTINNGSSKTLNILAQVTSYNTNFNTVASIYPGPYTDTDPDNNVVSINFTVPGISDLSITQKFSNYKVNYLHFFTIEVNVKNNGPNTAHNVIINCYLNPNNLGFVSCNYNNKYNSSSGIWTIGAMKPGSQTVLRIWTKLLVFNKWIANSVNIQTTTYDYNPSNNKANTALHSPSLTLNSLVNDLAVGTHTRYALASNILNWARDNIQYSFYYNTKYGASGTLKYLKGNCADTAHLVVALARISGFSARYKHGTCYFFKTQHWYGHVWASIYVNGRWYSADATGSKNSLGVIKNWDTSNYTLHGTYTTLPF